MTGEKNERPLIRYAGSAVETSIAPTPMGESVTGESVTIARSEQAIEETHR